MKRILLVLMIAGFLMGCNRPHPPQKYWKLVNDVLIYSPDGVKVIEIEGEDLKRIYAMLRSEYK